MVTKEIEKQSSVKNQTRYLKRGNPAWVKGVSGNPKGKPPKLFCMTSCLKDIGEKLLNEKIDVSKLTYKEAAALAMWKQAIKGETQAYNTIADRTEGRVKEIHDVNMAGELNVGNAREQLISRINSIVIARGTCETAQSIN